MSSENEGTTYNGSRVIEQQMPLMASPTPIRPVQSSPQTPTTVSRNSSTSATPSQNPKKRENRWMLQSSVRSFFEITTKNGKKVASCIYCSKRYPEGESTGNLAKHLRSLHATAYEKKGLVKKTGGLAAFAKNRRSLKVDRLIWEEYKQNPVTFHTALMVVEGFLPLSIVQLSSWAKLSRFTTSNSFVKSRGTLAKKLRLYANLMDNTLSLNLKNSHLVNVQLDIRTARNGESFLGIMVSFVPNIEDVERIEFSNSSRVLLNDMGIAHNTHLLDFVSLGDKKYSGENICQILTTVLEKHQLMDKVATLTMDNTTNNHSVYFSLIYDVFKKSKAKAHKLFGRACYIRCASHVLNLHFRKVLTVLYKYDVFANAARKIQALAKLMRRSKRMDSSLRSSGIPLIPNNTTTRWMGTWCQVKGFLENYPRYREWLNQLREEGSEEMVKKVEALLSFDERTIGLLRYFVQCIKVFGDLALKLQNDQFNHLSNGVPLYYLLDYFYAACDLAKQGKTIRKGEPGTDFSSLNAPDDLLEEDRNVMLSALYHSSHTHRKYLSYVRRSAVYYVAFILDPSFKTESLYKMMNASEASLRVKEAHNFIRAYFKELKRPSNSRHESLALVPGVSSECRLDFERQELVDEDLDPDVSANGREHGDNAVDGDNVSMQEFHAYLNEPKLTGNSKEEAIAWWYERRSRFPKLFKLAISLFYTKLSSCEVEGAFSLAGRVMRKDRKRLTPSTLRTLMVLRDRFTRFDFYDKAPIELGELHDRRDDIFSPEEVPLDPHEFAMGSDEAIYDTGLDEEAATDTFD
ncbi:LAQU0S11e03290g1_1 [Lachancea quebecensis]|uniref:LAQU0S11e03290g1_1 n=1 Tax=Lachancea quebecensis TaxID=1654605 RepID=A0A0P1L145_9SACH|nr:LAQU0S11e03290g1_1 [Lachancea quebecensis]